MHAHGEDRDCQMVLPASDGHDAGAVAEGLSSTSC